VVGKTGDVEGLGDGAAAALLLAGARVVPDCVVAEVA
jgi:hypothetical protein